VIDPEATPDSPAGTPARRTSTRWRRDLVFFAIAMTVVAADQLTKWLVRQHLELGE